VLFTLAVALGILTTQRLKARWWPAFVSQELHRNVSLLAMSFLAIHIVTILNDRFVRLGSPIPFSSPFRPFWIGIGLVATYLLAAVLITSLVRRWLPYNGWRTVHWLTYPSWLLAVGHGIGSGTDAGTWWGRVLIGACLLLIGAALLIRASPSAGQAFRRS
jgi:sulfoxide reductase heme-binding subunit YedZ